MSNALTCPHCGRAIPPAMHIYTFIRLRCECGGGVVLVSNRLADSIDVQSCVVADSGGSRHAARPGV